MRLIVLGCSAAYPVPGNPASGYLVETAGGRIWLDAGTGTFAALQSRARREGRHWAELDGLVISHAHADHCLDVVPLYYALRFLDDGEIDPGGRAGTLAHDPRPLPLFWPPGCRAVLGPAVHEQRPVPGVVEAEAENKLGRVFALGELVPDRTVELAGARITCVATDHSVPTLALAVDADGRRLVYTADTGPGVDLAPFAAGADLLLAEATYQEGRVGPPVHLSAAQAGELARRAEAARLVVTHVWPTLDPERSGREAAAAAGTVPVEVAAAGRSFEV